VDSIPALLRAYGLYPKKGLGQNFLTDASILGRIVDAADLAPGDTVLEIGPGLGSLTRLLAERSGRVVAVEIDERLVAILGERLADLRHVEIVRGNILKISDFASLLGPAYKVVANLPYGITSAVLRHLLESNQRPSLLVITVQREVAERIAAGPGDMSLLAVSVQFYGRPQIVTHIPAGAFYPPPQVDSAVLRVDVSPEPTVTLGEGVSTNAFFHVVRAGFSQKRKTLRNALSAGLRLAPAHVEEVLLQAGIDPRRRAETLSLPEWASLAGSF
jgi:16S rRNA (adenine1518-N6/adenine1519-N6)-dimethyltransferase